MVSYKKGFFMDFIFRFLAVTGFLTIIAIILIGTTVLIIRRSRTVLPSRSVLEIDFSPGLVETTPEGIVNRFLSGDVLKIRDIVSVLEMAASDRRIKGLIAHIGRSPLPLADVQEIRNAVFLFRKSGKPAFAFSESFGESGGGNSLYYLAAAFDSIYLQPSGEVSITGFLAMSPFIKGALDSLSIQPQLAHREEYKTAKNFHRNILYRCAT
jgi:protease-4